MEQLQALPPGEKAGDVLKAALEARSAAMDAIAEQMVDVLRTKEADAAVHGVIAAPIILYVNLRDTVLNPGAADMGKQHPLATQGAMAGSEHEKVNWLKAVHVSSRSSLVGPGMLFSFQVTVHLGDRSARKTGREVNGGAERLIREPVALVAFVPTQRNSDGQAAHDSLAAGTARTWRANRFSATVVYAPALLGRWRLRHEDTPVPSENRMVAARVIFASLVRIALEAPVDMAEADGQDARDGASFGPGRMVLLRQQLRGKGADWDEGDHGVYAVSQAVEHVLGKRLPVTLQGLTSKPHLRDIRSKRSFDAVVSGFDLRIACDGGASLPLGKLGVIAFASRPCDTDLVEEPKDDDRHVVIGRTYLAEASKDGFVLRRGPNLADTYSGVEVTSDPSVVKEAVKHFVDGGCRAIATISHKFAGRAIGRSAIRHMHHESADFQSHLAADFPGVVFYPLVRDTMRVVRTRDESSRTAFEVVGKDDHIHRCVNQAMRDGFWRRGIVPLYSLATLFHVKARADMGMRPLSGLSMYYLLLGQSLDFGNAALRSQNALLEGSPDQLALTEVIRAMHLLEAEDGAQKGKAKPVLNPAAWMSPATVAGAGEFRVMERRRRASGTVELSAVAVMARVSSALRAIRAPSPRPGPAPRPGAFPLAPPIVPPTAQELPASGVADGQSNVGYGNGWTVAREWWRGLPKRSRLKEAAAIWCPLDLKERRPGHEAHVPEEERLARGREFADLFGTAVAPGRLVAKGASANADFILMLERRRGQRRLLCLEFSLNMPSEIDGFGTEEAHAREMSRYTRLVSGRGVFSNFAAEVEGVGFTASAEMVGLAFAGRDKPLYKLAQGCSYASVLAAMLPQEVLAAGLHIDVVAVTAAGIESVNAPLGTGSQGDAKRQLVEALGNLYRSADKTERPFGGAWRRFTDRSGRGCPGRFARASAASWTCRPAAPWRQARSPRPSPGEKRWAGWRAATPASKPSSERQPARLLAATCANRPGAQAGKPGKAARTATAKPGTNRAGFPKPVRSLSSPCET